MSLNQEETSALIAGFFARGGCIQKIPEASPATAADVIQYLHSQGVPIELDPAEMPEGKFRHNGGIVDLQGLVQIANRLRRKQHLADFEVSLSRRKSRAAV